MQDKLVLEELIKQLDRKIRNPLTTLEELILLNLEKQYLISSSNYVLSNKVYSQIKNYELDLFTFYPIYSDCGLSYYKNVTNHSSFYVKHQYMEVLFPNQVSKIEGDEKYFKLSEINEQDLREMPFFNVFIHNPKKIEINFDNDDLILKLVVTIGEYNKQYILYFHKTLQYMDYIKPFKSTEKSF